MEYMLHSTEQGFLRFQAADIALFQYDVRVCLVLCEVLFAAAYQVVHGAHGVATRHQQVNHMAADEPRTAGYDSDWFRRHAAFSDVSRRTLK